jgi:hypothetical protein
MEDINTRGPATQTAAEAYEQHLASMEAGLYDVGSFGITDTTLLSSSLPELTGDVTGERTSFDL